MTAERIQKKDIARRLADRMKTNETALAMWLDAMLDTLYESFKAGQSVALSGFGNFYVRPERERWVFRFRRRSCGRCSAGLPPTKAVCEDMRWRLQN